MMGEERLQKVIANFGLASRRKAEEMILEGRVIVNGKVVSEMGVKVDILKDYIRVDNKLLKKKPPVSVFYVFNKPKNVITSLSDPEHRPALGKYLTNVNQRLFPVGRLDFDSEGLIILTNNGEVCHKLMHPSYEISRTYKVKIKGIVEQDKIKIIGKGILLDDGPTKSCALKVLEVVNNNSWILITLTEGRNRQVRRMFEKFGYLVIKLRRVSFAGIKLGALKTGELRLLSEDEKKILNDIIKTPAKEKIKKKLKSAAMNNNQKPKKPKLVAKKNDEKPKRTRLGTNSSEQKPKKPKLAAKSSERKPKHGAKSNEQKPKRTRLGTNSSEQKPKKPKLGAKSSEQKPKRTRSSNKSNEQKKSGPSARKDGQKQRKKLSTGQKAAKFFK